MVCEIRNARYLEPHDVRGVMSDALGIRLGETDADVVGAAEPLRHTPTIDRWGSLAAAVVV